MISECGIVTGLDGSLVRVRCERQAGCVRCAEGKGCGGGLLGRWLAGRLHEVEAHGGLPGLAVGDRVRLGLDERVLARAAMLAYGVPLAGLLLGALGGGLLGAQGEAAAPLLGFGGLAAGLILARRIARRWAQRLQPRLLERLP